MTTTVEIKDEGFVNGRPIVPDFLGAYDVTLERDGNIIDTIPMSPRTYTWVTATYLVVSVLTFFATAFFGTIEFDSITVGGAIVSFQLFHFALSFATLNKDENGTLSFAGRLLLNRGPGLVFRPLGLIWLERWPRITQQVQVPGEDAVIFSGNDDQFSALPADERAKFVKEFRVPSGKPAPDADLTDPLERQMTFGVIAYVRWRIEQLSLFASRVGSVEAEKANLDDSLRRCVREICSKYSFAKLNRDLSQFNDDLLSALEERTQEHGISIVEVGFKMNLSRVTNVALLGIGVKMAEATQTVIETRGITDALVIKAGGDAKATVIGATAAKKKAVLEGEGEGANRASIGKGDAFATQAGYEALANGAKALGDVSGSERVIDLEKTRAIANGNGNTTVFVGGDSATNVTGIGAQLAMGAQVATKPKPEQSTKPE